MNNFSIRSTTKNDAGLILDFIKRLAEYEKMSDDVVADEHAIKETLFSENPKAECLIAYSDEKPVGFALYFFNYSTFLGKYGLYLEDLFVLPEERGNGFGKKLLKYLASTAVEKGCGRFEWSVLDWNKPAIDFYKKAGAEPMDEWTVFRLTGKALTDFANGE